MIKNRSFIYKRIVVLTEKRMEELESILSKHCDCINYKAITKNKSEILFDSFDELIAFNNFGDDKIISLCVICRKRNNCNFMIDIDFSPLFPFETETVKCGYCFSEVDKESVFIADFKKFLNKISIYHTKYMICELASLAFFVILGLYPIIIQIGGTKLYQSINGIYPLIMSILLFEAISIGLYKLCSKLIWKKLFPKAIFAWGEEKEKFSKLEKLRSNLFWAVLVAAVISFVVGIILK